MTGVQTCALPICAPLALVGMKSTSLQQLTSHANSEELHLELEFRGSYKPEEPLSGFDNRGAEGTWTLEVGDTFSLDADGTLNSWSLTIETPDTPITIPSSDIPKAIPDNVMTTSTITSCNALMIVDVNVQLDITHTYDEDLDIFLIAPDGTRIELSTDNGSFFSHYTNTIFDDEAAGSITDGTAPFTGSYQPEEPLSVLDGTSAIGTWTLEITDDNAPDPGTLNSWSLTFELIDESYTISTYASGLPLSVAGLTVDQSTRTLYYADMGIPFGTLRQITPDGTVSLVTNSFAPIPENYAFTSTDIQFLNGNVYVSLASGKLAKIDTATGITTSDHTFIDYWEESGIAVKNGQLLVTSGIGPATEIRLYDTKTGTAGLALDVSPLPEAYSVEYDRVNDATYFWSDGAFYRADLGAGTYAIIPSYTTFRDDFAVSPDGNYLITSNHANSNIEFVSVVDGSSTTLYNGLKVSARHDMVLAQSSAVRGCSLYVVDGASILEISGFERCNPFPWAMFFPAISNKAQN